MSGELRLVKRAPSQTSCILFVFSSVQVSPQYNDCTFLRSFGLRAYITFICALTCSLCSATLFSASIFASYLVETPFRPVGIWVLVCILVGMPTAQSVTDNPTSYPGTCIVSLLRFAPFRP